MLLGRVGRNDGGKEVLNQSRDVACPSRLPEVPLRVTVMAAVATVASMVKCWTQNVKSTTEVPQNTLEGDTKLSQL
jgi:hypothetical protein